MTTAGKSRWSDEDLALLRALGGRLSEIIHGEDVEVPDLQRRDELGILANMVSRLARELRGRRREDQLQRRELERRVAELSSAYETQEKLLTTIRSLPSPVLEIHEGILLVPIPFALDAARVGYVLPSLLERVVARRPEVVIVHLEAAEPVSAELATILARAAQSLRQAGARALLSGVPPPHPTSLSALSPCEALPEAIAASLDLLGLRLTR